MKTDWKKLGFVLAGNYRSSIVKALSKGPKTPKDISLETGLYLSHVSKTLGELVDVEVVECLTPSLRKGKLYALTHLGTEAANYINVREKREKGHIENSQGM